MAINLSIREAQVGDSEKIVMFQMEMAFETEMLKLDREVLREGVSAIFDDRSKGTYYVAESGAETIGCLLTTPEWSEWRNGTVLWIQSLYIIQSYRNQGVFKAFYTYLKEMVGSADHYKGLRLYVDKTNLSAQSVYEKVGMNGQHYQLYEWLK